MAAGGNPAPPDHPRSFFRSSVCCLVLAVLLYRAAYTVADPDLWGHVRFGQDIVATGTIVQTDTYSYQTEGRPWINHEWLAEVVFARAYEGLGPPGLIVLKVLLSAVILGLAYHHLGRQGLAPLPAGLVLLLASVPLFMGLATVRPHLFTYLLFLLILLILHQAERGRWGWLAAAPVVFALWVNLHGGFLAGFAILLLWSLARLGIALLPCRWAGAGGGPTALAIVSALAASLLALLLNPYGIGLLGFLLRTATVPRPEIAEWAPIRLGTSEGAVYLLLLALGSAGFVLCRRAPACSLVFFCTALLPLLAVRHVPLFALAFLVLAAEPLADVWNAWQSRDTVATPPPAWLTAANFSGALVLAALALPSFRGIHLEPRAFRYPVRAIALLKGSGVRGNLAVHFDWGEYAIWHLGPRIKVSIDGRRETVYADATYRDYWQFWNGPEDSDAFLQQPKADLALASKDFRIYQRMKCLPDWLLIYEDPLCGLFVRRGATCLETLEGARPSELPPDGQGLCFP